MKLTIYFIDGSCRRDIGIRDITDENEYITIVDTHGHVMEYSEEHIAMIVLKQEV